MDNIDRALGFVDVMRGLGSRLGPMFLQLPPRFSPSLLADLQDLSLRLVLRMCASPWKSVTWTGSSRHTTGRSMRCLPDLNMARVTIDTRPIPQFAGRRGPGGVSL
jgi:uncharacterized protein YecE (DUF72 family)